jgi:siroheme synthase-like protein
MKVSAIHIEKERQAAPPANHLFPVFLKLESLRVLLVGAGKVGEEKLGALLKNSPSAKVTVVAREISTAVRQLAGSYQLVLKEKEFSEDDLDNTDLVITALNDTDASRRLRDAARKRGLLVNAADKPELCDFYLGAIVQKGPVKIAISTNGQSPTMAKRLKEMLNEALPDDLAEATHNLHLIRENLKGDFEEKVRRLNEITRPLMQDASTEKLSQKGTRLRRIAFGVIFALAFMAIGHLLSRYLFY